MIFGIFHLLSHYSRYENSGILKISVKIQIEE